MPRLLRLLVIGLLALGTAACGSDDEEEPSAAATVAPAAGTTEAPDKCTPDQLALVESGTLTVGTHKPAYPPYFEDDEPSNGKGFESAVAYAVADELGFGKERAERVDFSNPYTPLVAAALLSLCVTVPLARLLDRWERRRRR